MDIVGLRKKITGSLTRSSASSATSAARVEAPVPLGRFKRWLLRAQFGLSARKTLYKKMGFYIRAGTPITTAMRQIRARYQKNKDFRAEMLGVWIQSMAEGNGFTKAIEGWIPTNELVLIRAAERSGKIEEGMDRALVASEAIARARAALAALTEPTLLMGMLVAIVVMFRVKMVPLFIGLLPLSAWSGNAKLLYATGGVLIHHWFLILALAVALAVATVRSLPRWTGPWRARLDRWLIPWTIYRMYQGAAFMVAIGGLLQTLSMDEGLAVIRRMATPWMREHIDVMRAALRRGESNMGRVLTTGLIDDDLAGDLEDFATIGGAVFDRVVRESGDEILEQNVKKIGRMSATAKVIMLFLVAGAVAWIYATSYLLMTQAAGSQAMAAGH